jgi:hypothetical protein
MQNETIASIDPHGAERRADGTFAPGNTGGLQPGQSSCSTHADFAVDFGPPHGRARVSGYGTGKPTLDSLHALDIRYLRREGLLMPHGLRSLHWSDVYTGERTATIDYRVSGLTWDHADEVHLVYRVTPQGGEPRHHDYAVEVSWTRCHLGGERPWFHCPECGRRVAKLYLAGDLFLCRPCHGLTYESCNEHPVWGKATRAGDRAFAIRQLLGDETRDFAFSARVPPRPKGMHRKTYARLREEHERCADLQRAAMWGAIDLFDGR